MKRLIPPPVMLAICIGLMLLAHRYFPAATIVPWPWTLIGVAVIVAGLALGLTGVYHFLRARTSFLPFQKPRQLVTGGVYRVTRNPMYLGDVVILIGIWILTGVLSAGIGVILFALVADLWYIRAEEKVLSQNFGPEFDRFRARTRRWI